MDGLLDDLRRARIGATFNLYAGAGGAVRLANLRRYLDERRSADVVALGEAAGYQGMRWSGIAFTSERDLLRWGAPYRLTSDRPEGWSEPSGTIVHRTLERLQAERRVVLWKRCRITPTTPAARSATAGHRRPRWQPAPTTWSGCWTS
jgi:hypothetical protein